MTKIAIIFAAGQNQRFFPLPEGVKHKSLLFLAGKTLIEHTINYLLKIKDLSQIIVVVGAEKQSFQFLLSKYPQLVLVFNSCFDCHRSGCALLSIKNYLLKANQAIFVAGDIVCYQNYFLHCQNINTMAAVIPSPNSHQNKLFYHLNSQQEIIKIDHRFSPYLVGEFSTLNKDWIASIYRIFFDHQQHFANQEIYQILLKSALKNNIKVKMHLLHLPGPSDVDDWEDWKRVEKLF